MKMQLQQRKAFRFAITEIAFTMIKRIILVLEIIRLVLSNKLVTNKMNDYNLKSIKKEFKAKGIFYTTN